MTEGILVNEPELSNIQRDIGEITGSMKAITDIVIDTQVRTRSMEEKIIRVDTRLGTLEQNSAKQSAEMASLNSVDRKMEKMGFDCLDSKEHKKDMQFVRELRITDKKKSDLWWKVVGTVIGSSILLFLAYVGLAVTNSVSLDLNNANESRYPYPGPLQQPSNNGHSR